MINSRVLVVEDDGALRDALCDTLEYAGYQITSAADGREALSRISECPVDLVVSDVQMKPMDGRALLDQIKIRQPNLPVLLMTAFGTVEQAVNAVQAGAENYLMKPFDGDALINMVGRYIAPDASDESKPIAAAPATQKVFNAALRVAKSDATVLITGASGCGKEVVSQYIHKNSSRKDKPFVAINCAAIPENMLEATLFGHEKGAFTGAYQASSGKFEQANGGTLLLDEISEMDLSLQAKILRVLQEQEVERVGGKKIIQLDVRILATSNRNMRDEVAQGRFREDLYYRLNVFPIHLPSLSERKEDIVPLAENILNQYAKKMGVKIPTLCQNACSKMIDYSWPGNIRELDNVMQRALILSNGDSVEVEDLCFEGDTTAENSSPVVTEIDSVTRPTLDSGLKEKEYHLIAKALSEVSGCRKDAAKRLGVSQRTLRYKLAKMRELGFDVMSATGR